MQCEKCDKEFHHCTSCSPEDYLDAGFCSSVCFEDSEPYYKAKYIAEKFYSELDDVQRIDFDKFLEYYWRDEYQGKMDDWMEAIKKDNENG